MKLARTAAGLLTLTTMGGLPVSLAMPGAPGSDCVVSTHAGTPGSGSQASECGSAHDEDGMRVAPLERPIMAANQKNTSERQVSARVAKWAERPRTRCAGRRSVPRSPPALRSMFVWTRAQLCRSSPQPVDPGPKLGLVGAPPVWAGRIQAMRGPIWAKFGSTSILWTELD